MAAFRTKQRKTLEQKLKSLKNFKCKKLVKKFVRR